MVQIVLIRPGSTEYDLQGRIQGILDIPLSETGRQEAAAAVECVLPLSLTALYTSCCRAAQETAQILGKSLKLRPKKLDRLQNLDQGLWQGMLVEEVKRKQPKVYKQWQEHPEHVCPPEGEMLKAASERVESVLEKLLRKHRFGAIGLVIPEPLASVVRYRLRGDTLGDLWKGKGVCGKIEVFEVQPAIWRSRIQSLEVPARLNGDSAEEPRTLAEEHK